MNIGGNILEQRKKLGLSQEALAEKLSVSRQTISKWESNSTVPELGKLLQMSELFGISTDCLLTSVTPDKPREDLQPEKITIEKIYNQPTKLSKKKKRIWIIALLITIAIAVLGFLANKNEWFVKDFADDHEALETAAESVVMVYCYDIDGDLMATGSAFIAYNSYTVVTNFHVIENAYEIIISTQQDVEYAVDRILCFNEKKDIAIMTVSEDTMLSPLKVADSSAATVGDTVVAIGSPLGIKNTVSTGIISGRMQEDGIEILQFSAPISSGSSGGALFNNRGNVIGITFASYEEGQNLNLAVQSNYFSELYERKGPSLALLSYYNSFDHTEYLKSKTVFFSVGELLKQYENYNERYIYLTGWVSSISPLGGVSLVDMSSRISSDWENDSNQKNIVFANFLEWEDPDPDTDQNLCTVGDYICFYGYVDVHTYYSEESAQLRTMVRFYVEEIVEP